MNCTQLMTSQNSPYRVLIVDDENSHRFLESEILSAPKYSVTEASSGLHALTLLQAEKFDVVLWTFECQV